MGWVPEACFSTADGFPPGQSGLPSRPSLRQGAITYTLADRTRVSLEQCALPSSLSQVLTPDPQLCSEHRPCKHRVARVRFQRHMEGGAEGLFIRFHGLVFERAREQPLGCAHIHTPGFRMP